MAELMGEDVAENETLQRIGGPGDDTILAEVRAGLLEFSALVLRERVWKPPRRRRLVVQADVTGRDELAEEESASGGWRGDQFHRFESVVGLLAERRQGMTDVRRRGGMMSPGTWPACADDRKRSPTRGANATRITSAAVGHA